MSPLCCGPVQHSKCNNTIVRVGHDCNLILLCHRCRDNTNTHAICYENVFFHK